MNRIVACRPEAEQAINHRGYLPVSAKRPYYHVNPVNPVKIELYEFGSLKNLFYLDFFFFL